MMVHLEIRNLSYIKVWSGKLVKETVKGTLDFMNKLRDADNISLGEIEPIYEITKKFQRQFKDELNILYNPNTVYCSL